MRTAGKIIVAGFAVFTQLTMTSTTFWVLMGE
jgi:hypothetical protein